MELSEKEKEMIHKTTDVVYSKFREFIRERTLHIAIRKACEGNLEMLGCLHEVNALVVAIISELYCKGKIAIKEDGKP